MKLDCVLTATNDNPLYLDFIPIFIQTWNKLYPNVDVKIILIAYHIPENLLQYKDNIILFHPIDKVLTSFTAQFIRLLYPCIMDYENGVLITDMDMLPMNRTYYTDHINDYDNDKFIYYRENVCLDFHQIAMCYNIATPKTWRDIFGIDSLDKIKSFILRTSRTNIIREGHGNIGWDIDQTILYKNVMDWDKSIHNHFVRLNDKKTGFKRLDRNTFDINNTLVKKNITNGVYSDYHCYRPMSKYASVNYEIYNLL